MHTSLLLLFTPLLQGAEPSPLLAVDGTELDRAAFERFVEEQRARLHVAGISLAVLRDGEVVLELQSGHARAEGGAPVTSDTLFEAASITKPVFAQAVMRLVDVELLDLDEPLHELLEHPDLEDDERAGAITARMVLAHTTGLPNWRRGELRLGFDPGTAFEYSGEAYVYLGHIVEALAERSLDEFVQQEVFEPAGMTDSTLVWTPEIEARKATRHANGDVPVLAAWRPVRAVPASSLHTTARDLGRFLEQVLARRGMSSEVYDEMFARQSAPGPDDPKQDPDGNVSWGLGWVRRATPLGPRLEHGGSNEGFRAYLEAYPERGAGFVGLTNSDRGQELLDVVVEYLRTGTAPEVPPMDPRARRHDFDDAAWSFDGDVRVARTDDRSILEGAGWFQARLAEVAPANLLIDLDVSVDRAHGFAGVTFRGADGGHEEVYLRAHESGESTALQYAPVFHGVQCWQLYPGFNHHRTAYFRQRDWMHLRLAVFEDWMEVYLDDMDRLALHVYDLKHGERPGRVGLWGTPGVRFANVTVTPLEEYEFFYDHQPLPIRPARYVPEWEVSEPFPRKRLGSGERLPVGLADGLAWSSLPTEHTGVVNFARLAGTEVGDTVLARFRLEAEESCRVRLTLGYSDRVVAYLEGEGFFAGDNGLGARGEGSLGMLTESDGTWLSLDRGVHEVVLGVTEELGGWGALAALEGSSGVRVLPARR